MARSIGILWIFALLGVPACDEGKQQGDGLEETESYIATAGFVSLPPREIVVAGKRNFTANAEIFYAFVPAEEAPEEKPLLVIFNGGPSAAASSALFSYGTGPYLVDWKNNGAIARNPNSFSALGNLLYIDPRQTGFSYETTEGFTYPPAVPYDFQHPEYCDMNYNIYTDASDLILVLLDVLNNRPLLQQNPVVLMGESFGGVRAAMMLHLLRRPGQLTDPHNPYQDTALFAALAAHFAETIPGVPLVQIPPNEITAQFGRQVLIQPGGMMFGVATTFPPFLMTPGDPRIPYCNDDFSFIDIRQPHDYSASLLQAAHTALLNPTSFEKLFGIAPEAVDGMRATDRPFAFRYEMFDQAPSPEWIAKMGALTDTDRYHVPFCEPCGSTIIWKETSSEAFIENLTEVHTFITNAYWDGTVDTSLLPLDLMQASNEMAKPPLAGVVYDTAPRAGTARPGWLQLTYNAYLDLPAGTVRTVRMPTYMDAGHMVPLTQAADLRDDIAEFLQESGAYR